MAAHRDNKKSSLVAAAQSFLVNALPSKHVVAAGLFSA
jgi:hypothetical protein